MSYGVVTTRGSTTLYRLRRHQFQRSKTTLSSNFCGARNLSNHAKASSKPLFANLKILDVFSIYSVQVSSFMYLYHNDALPIYFTQIFNTGNQIHQYSTRYSDFYRPHTCRTNIKKISILFQGPRIWISFLVGEPRPRNERFVHPSPQKRFDSGLLLFDNS